MIRFLHISFLLFVLTSCQEATSDSASTEEDKGDVYISDFGQVTILQLNDTLYQTSFLNNEGFRFDTSMSLAENDSLFFQVDTDSNSFILKYHWGGLLFKDNKIQVFDFAGYGLLGTQTQMWEIYEKPFYKTGCKHKISGDLIGSKGIMNIGEIYLTNTEAKEGKYYEFEGFISKEEWPIDYYSTDESPQGVFGSDTSVKHFRLVMDEPKDITPQPFTYTGTTINTSTGKAAIAWDFADSEAYYLDNHPAWTKNEELKRISVSGILIQNEQGSVLKNWKIN